MSETSQASASRRTPETEISVDLTEAEPSKAVERRAKPADIAEGVRDERGGRQDRSPSERAVMKRMTSYQKQITKEFDQKLAAQEARHQQEMTALREQLRGVSVEGRGGDEAASAHEAAMKVLEEQLAAANEKGDSVAAAAITRKMTQADGAYHAKLAGAKQRADTATPAPQQQQAVKPQRTGPTPAGSRFILANEDWWQDPEFQLEKDYASTIYLELVNEKGWDNNSDETFREVGRRLKEKFVNLPVVVGPEDEDEDEDEDGRNRRRAPTANIQDRGAAATRRNNGSRRTLSAAERKTMVQVGLSPDNDRDVVQFLREAVAMEQSA